MQALPAQPSRSQSDSGQPGGPRRAAGERTARSLGPRRLSPKPCRGAASAFRAALRACPQQGSLRFRHSGALVDIAREAIVLPMASKSTQPTLEVADSESDDNASWSVCSPRSAKPRPLQGGLALQPWKPSGPSEATKRASDLLIPSNSPCLPGAFPKPRAAAPVHHVGGPACPPPSHWEDRKGAWPPPALPKPAPAVRPRARSLAGPYSLSSLASASRVLSRPLRTFSLPQPSLALNQHFAALRQGQPLHQLQGHISCSLHRRKQPSALEDSAAYQHGQVCCKPWVPQASSGHKFSKRSMWQTTWPHQSGSTPWGPWKPTSRSALGSWTSAFAQAFRWEHSLWLPWRITYKLAQNRTSRIVPPAS